MRLIFFFSLINIHQCTSLFGWTTSSREILTKSNNLCTSSYNFENFMQKFHLGQKLLTILVFCLFERNCRLFFQSTGDSVTERSERSLRIFLKIFKTNVKRILQSFCGRVASRLEQLSAISFEKIQRNLKRFLQSFCDRVASRIKQQSAISFKKTKNKNR